MSWDMWQTRCCHHRLRLIITIAMASECWSFHKQKSHKSSHKAGINFIQNENFINLWNETFGLNHQKSRLWTHHGVQIEILNAYNLAPDYNPPRAIETLHSLNFIKNISRFHNSNWKPLLNLISCYSWRRTLQNHSDNARGSGKFLMPHFIYSFSIAALAMSRVGRMLFYWFR